LGFTLLPFAAIGQTAEAPPPPASAQDCEILAAAGRAQLDWGQAAPSQMMRRQSFGVDCNWAAMGLAPPTIAPPSDGPYYEGIRFAFSKPVYTGGTSATVIVGHIGNGGPKTYFIASYICTVTRQDGAWGHASCRMRYIT
jgi:hypothetical protein